ncbi:FG-GAP repeat domain-containing protein [Thalassovita aquimarina]|uniref:VCBS repeat-containing protein n=1 Tax=Thalassovita aquimarina TaxID=2785917 RepID=A0ABS5HV51_9RHOB|nr:VCBS repeat-containing protein [Thalassovita aquimarina]MBR9652847.1 VCBS repeat-containing protein [Thalassovita aquimarina]
MRGRARRYPARPWRHMARRAGLALGLCAAFLAGPVAAEIQSARFADPTTRYAHGVFGDPEEWGALRMRLSDGRKLIVRLPENRVFEDLSPRLIDVDGDGDAEVVVVETDIARGAALAIYDETGKVAQTPHIGRTHRWLAPLGGADLDGDGFVELAYIDRPHLARTLRVWRFRDGGLSEVAALKGLTNHLLGDPGIGGGIRDCGRGPEIVTADADWHRVMAVRLENGRLYGREIGRFEGPESFDRALNCRD